MIKKMIVILKVIVHLRLGRKNRLYPEQLAIKIQKMINKTIYAHVLNHKNLICTH